MRLKICVINLCVLLSLTGVFFVPAPGLAQEAFPFQGLINEDDINIRSDSTTGASIICVGKKGTRLEVVGENYDWYEIRLPPQAPSYVSKELVECLDSKTVQSQGTDFAAKAPQRCQSGKILKDRVNIRLEPDLSSQILGKADQNEIVTIASETQDWYKILPIQNSFGWIHKKFISKAPAEETVKVALKPKEEAEGDPLVIEGILSPRGFIFKGPATHKLITEDKRIFLLKGDRAGLKALNHRKAKVTGRLLGKFDQKYPTVEVKILEVLD
ncbi:MAG: SH3 domain-containing protein [Candidatus Omnitrophota bacterium]